LIEMKFEIWVTFPYIQMSLSILYKIKNL